ncbi:hypothetical protein FcAc13_08350 [Frischella sp. Ac13]|uniref:Phage neck terminator protein gp12-like domain-containing protein n=1 Tax=Frischella japonica TaxID=2741544 RepID=A0ABR7QYP6_9GAMM|nr:hypothetical protein [Frischella japonica]MBC9131319.1 hypothetical protein [Frischella japonica]
MTITTVQQLDMQGILKMIAVALSLPDDLVIDAANSIDISHYQEYMTVLALSQTEIGSQITYDSDNEVEIIHSVNELVLSVNAYGSRAFQLISQLISSMSLSFMKQWQRQLKIGFLRSSAINTLSTEKPQQVQVELIFSISNIFKADVYIGESVQIITEVNK